MSARAVMPARRPLHRETVVHDRLAIQVTVGLRPETGAPGEVFLASPREGSAIQELLSDAAVVISIALQHGATPAELAKSMGTRGADGSLTGAGGRASVIGRVADLLVTLDPDGGGECAAGRVAAATLDGPAPEGRATGRPNTVEVSDAHAPATGAAE